MLLGELRAEVTAVCGQLTAAGLIPGTSGNVSARHGDLVAVTPSGLDYAALTAGLVGVHRLDGSPVEAPLQPTSELPLHLSVYVATGAGRKGILYGPSMGHAIADLILTGGAKIALEAFAPGRFAR